MSTQELAQELSNLLTCSICLKSVHSPIYQCCNGHLICANCIKCIEESNLAREKQCSSCSETIDGRIRNLVAEALLNLFPTESSDDKSRNKSGHSMKEDIITYKIICKEVPVFSNLDKRQNAILKIPRNSYIEVNTIVDVPNEHTVLGNLETGGWITLNNSLTEEIFATPLDIGVYQNQSKNNQVTIEFDFNSGKKGILEKGAFLDVVHVRYCSQNNLVRGELATGSWVNLINGQTGEIYAKPLQLGAYVTNGANEAYFDIIEISHASEIQRVRGNLPTGEWFSLVNTEEDRWAAHAINLGAYRTLVPLTVYGGLEKGSLKVKNLDVDEFVDILLTLTVPDSDIIRGKISTGGWVDLINFARTQHFAEYVQLGLYQTGSQEFYTTESVDLSSIVRFEITPKSFLEIIEICYLSEENCLRGRRKSGDWISLYNTIDGNAFAKSVPLGAYWTLEGVSNTENENKESKELKFCSSCSYCDVVELRQMEKDTLIRGRLSSGGWISICKTNGDTQRWAEPVFQGVYEALIANKANSAIEFLDSENLYEVKPGTLIEVLETRVTLNNSHVRGRITTGGWVTLVSTNGGDEWAKALHIGIYKTTVDQKVFDKVHAKSSRKKISAGRVVVLTKFRLLPNFSVVRGKLDIDGWIDIVNTDEKIYFVKPLPLGQYKIVAKTFLSNGLSLQSKVGKKVKKGTIVEVVYMQIVSEDQRVRARLMSGGWISLMNTYDGFEWAEYNGVN